MKSEKDLRKYTYTTGAFITPFFDKETKRWMWVVTEFDSDTYCDGEYIDTDIVATEIMGLVKLEENVDDEYAHLRNPDFCAKCGGECEYDDNGELI